MNSSLKVKLWKEIIDNIDFSPQKKPTIDSLQLQINKIAQSFKIAEVRYTEQAEEIDLILAKVKLLEEERRQLKDQIQVQIDQNNNLTQELEMLQSEDQRKQDELFEKSLQAGLGVVNQVWKSLLNKVGIREKQETDALNQLQILYEQELEKMYNVVCEEINKQNDSITQLTYDLQQSNTNCDHLKKQLIETQKDLDQLKIQMGEKIKLINEEKIQIIKEKDQLENEFNSTLQLIKAEYSQQNQNQYQKTQNLIQEVTNLNQKVNEYETKEQQRIKSDQQNILKIQDLENKIIQERLRNEGLRKDLNKFEQDQKTHQKENNALVEQLQIKEQAYRMMESKRKKDKQQINELKTMNQQLKIQIQQIQQSSNEKCTTLEDQIQQSQRQIEVVQSNPEIPSFDSMINVNESEELKAQICQLQEINSNNQQKIKELQNSLEQLQAKRQFSINEIERLQRIIDQLGKQNDQLSQQATPKNSQITYNPVQFIIHEEIVQLAEQLRNLMNWIYKDFLSHLFSESPKEQELIFLQNLKNAIKTSQDLCEFIEDNQT